MLIERVSMIDRNNAVREKNTQGVKRSCCSPSEEASSTGKIAVNSTKNREASRDRSDSPYEASERWAGCQKIMKIPAQKNCDS